MALNELVVCKSISFKNNLVNISPKAEHYFALSAPGHRSSDLAGCDAWLYPKSKIAVNDMKENATKQLMAIFKNWTLMVIFEVEGSLS